MQLGTNKVSAHVSRKWIENIKNRPSHGLLHSLLKWCHYQFTVKDPSSIVIMTPGVCQFIKDLASQTPVCYYLISTAADLDHALIEENVKENMATFQKIKLELPMFFQLLKEINEAKLPEEFKDVVLHLITKAVTPFRDHHFIGRLAPTPDSSEWLCK